MSKNDGGYVYPHTLHEEYDGDPIAYEFRGMTLRQWYAGQALVSLHRDAACDPWDYDELAAHCLAVADAMIAAEKGQDNEKE